MILLRKETIGNLVVTEFSWSNTRLTYVNDYLVVDAKYSTYGKFDETCTALREGKEVVTRNFTGKEMTWVHEW